MAGRGFGKTRAGSEWIKEQVAAGARQIALIGETAADTRDVMVEGSSGLLSIYPESERPLYEPSKRRVTWPNGARATLFNATEPNQLRGPQFDCAWCFVAGTMVETPKGQVAIESIKAGDLVETRKGPKRVEAVSVRRSDVGSVAFKSGAVLVGTADHPVYTLNGWTRLDSLLEDSLICVSNAWSGAGSNGTAMEETTTSAQLSEKAARGLLSGFTGRSTGIEMEAFRTATTFTTSTVISLTTHLKTLWRSLVRNTSSFIRKTLTLPELLQSLLLQLKLSRCHVMIAGQRSFERNRPSRLFAQSASTSGQLQGGRSSGIAASAGSFLSQGRVTFVRSGASTFRHMGEQDVFCLKVSEQPEYFANGILVHNCDELAKWRYARETWDMLQFGMRLGDHPRQIVTTTPRPIPLIRELMNDPDCVVTRGSTFDNVANMAPSFFEQVRKKYEGTRLGRQELNAEILDDMPGALWTRAMLDDHRRNQIPDLQRVLVAVDPAVTSTEDADYHGIVVAGSDEEQRGYVLDDKSLMGSPLEWARRAISVHDEYEADGIVVEVNQGGDMVAQTLRSVRPNIKIIEVRATRGKHVRAEPIAALYEQGRVSHVGTFPELEDQMFLMTPEGYQGENSPDRCDALVWAFTELFPSITKRAPSYDHSALLSGGGGGSWME